MVLDVAQWFKERKARTGFGELVRLRTFSSFSKCNSQAPTSPAVFAPYRNKLFNNILQNLNERGGVLYVGNDHGTSNQCSDVINNELGVGLITGNHPVPVIHVDNENPLM